MVSDYYRVAPENGPRIVVIGGGHGQSTLLRGLKLYSKNLTAIVAVTDDGGGSGIPGGTWECCRQGTFATAWRHWPVLSPL